MDELIVFLLALCLCLAILDLRRIERERNRTPRMHGADDRRYAPAGSDDE